MALLKLITSASNAVANLRQGDVLFFDIDETLLLCGIKKYEDAVSLTEDSLPLLIEKCKEIGIKIYGLTARDLSFQMQSVEQLHDVNIHLSEIIHAPSQKTNNGKIYTKGDVLRKWLQKNGHNPKRILVIDDSKNELLSIQESFSHLSDNALILYHYIRPKFKQFHHIEPGLVEASFPVHLNDFNLQEALGGSTKSTFLITAPNWKNPLVLKFGAHPDALKAEIMTNTLYRILDVSVPPSQIYYTVPNSLAKACNISYPHGFFQISHFISNQSNSENELIQHTRRHFVAHALLGNIDVAKPNNFVGKTLVDAGANFLFRACGKPRKEDPSIVSEIFTLKDPTINPRAFEWFGEITNAEIKAQIINILEKQDVLEQKIWEVSAHLKFSPQLRDAYLQNFADRLDHLVIEYCPEARLSAKIDRKTSSQTAAGILTFTLIDQQPHILLAKRVRHDWWDNFGGMSEAGDQWLHETAAREVSEESNQLIFYTNYTLINSPSHDLISSKHGARFIYRLYIATHSFVAPDLFKDKEHTEYTWVPVNRFIDALDKNELVEMEGQTTISLNLAEGKKLTLYPPLYEILSQKSVKLNIQCIQNQKRLIKTHTQSVILDRSKPDNTPLFRVVQSPESIRHQINSTLINYADLLRDLKIEQAKINATNTVVQTSEEITPSDPTPKLQLSQSEFHLQVILGDNYQHNNLNHNIEAAWDKLISWNVINEPLSENIKNKLTSLIKTEKAHPEQIYFYHACDEQIGFVYFIYSSIFHWLNINNQGLALRILNTFLSPYPDIQAFIAAHSIDGQINNFQDDYREHAISANLFIFGNHRSKTSCSLAYLMENKTRIPINLSQLLEKTLGPLSVSSDTINKTVQLFNTHVKGVGGRLYQISLDKDSASRLSYIAGLNGALKPYEDTHNTDIVLTTLMEKGSQGNLSKADREYIRSVQARVLVPSASFSTYQTVRYAKLDQVHSQTFYQEINQIIMSICWSLLHTPSDKITMSPSSIPLMKIQDEVYKLNSLPLITESSTCTMDEPKTKNRPLSKLAAVREVPGETERRTGVDTLVHEDSSTVSTQQFSTAVGFRKRSNNQIALKAILQDHPQLTRAYLSKFMEKKSLKALIQLFLINPDISGTSITSYFGEDWIAQYTQSQLDINELFCTAVKAGQWMIVEQMMNAELTFKPDSSAIGYALCKAAYWGYETIVQKIIQMNTNNKPSSDEIYIALNYAINPYYGSDASVQAILLSINKMYHGNAEAIIKIYLKAIQLGKAGIVKTIINMYFENEEYGNWYIEQYLFGIGLKAAIFARQWSIVKEILMAAEQYKLDFKDSISAKKLLLWFTNKDFLLNTLHINQQLVEKQDELGNIFIDLAQKNDWYGIFTLLNLRGNLQIKPSDIVKGFIKLIDINITDQWLLIEELVNKLSDTDLNDELISLFYKIYESAYVHFHQDKLSLKILHKYYHRFSSAQINKMLRWVFERGFLSHENDVILRELVRMSGDNKLDQQFLERKINRIVDDYSQGNLWQTFIPGKVQQINLISKIQGEIKPKEQFINKGIEFINQSTEYWIKPNENHETPFFDLIRHKGLSAINQLQLFLSDEYLIKLLTYKNPHGYTGIHLLFKQLTNYIPEGQVALHPTLHQLRQYTDIKKVNLTQLIYPLHIINPSMVERFLWVLAEKASHLEAWMALAMIAFVNKTTNSTKSFLDDKNIQKALSYIAKIEAFQMSPFDVTFFKTEPSEMICRDALLACKPCIPENYDPRNINGFIKKYQGLLLALRELSVELKAPSYATICKVNQA